MAQEPGGFKALLAESEGYLAFFKRRADIEDAYASDLHKLSQEPVEGNLPTLKSAWSALRREVTREADARRQYANALRMLVQDPLSSFRDAKERVRKRIKDELKTSASDHAEYRTTVARLQKAYERKCEEVRALQTHESMNIGTSTSTSPPDSNHASARSITPLPLDHSPPTSPSGSSAAASNAASSATTQMGHTQPIVAGAISLSLSPQPTALHPPGVTTAAGRAQDAFKASKTQFNSLIQRMGGESQQGRSETSSTRATRLRREAEEADNMYRKGVFHLETLRLRRERVLNSSLISAEEFALDLSSYMRNMLRTVVDLTLENTGDTARGCDLVLEKALEISAEFDVTSFAQKLPLEPPAEPPLLYNNCYVGPCKSLQFGVVSLTDYASAHNGQLVPLVLLKSIAEVEARGLDHEGIYRVPGRTAAITDAVLQMEKDEDAFVFNATQHGPDTVAGVLKLYLRQLPNPLFPVPYQDRMSVTRLAETDMNEVYLTLTKRLRRIAPSHQATLKLLCEHLGRVAAHEEHNRMTLSNLGVVFAPVVFGEEDPSVLQAAASGAGQHSIAKDRCMEILIAHHAILFEGLPIQQEPLPESRVRGRALSNASGHLSDEEFPIRRPSISGNLQHRSSARRARSPLARQRVTPASPSPRTSLDYRPSSSPPSRPSSAMLVSPQPVKVSSPALHPAHGDPALDLYAAFEAQKGSAPVSLPPVMPAVVRRHSSSGSARSLPPGARAPHE